MKIVSIIILTILLTYIGFDITTNYYRNKRTAENNHGKNNYKQPEIKNEAFDFLVNHEYDYSKSKKEIPQAVIDSMSKLEKESYKIGDTSDSDRINLSCCRIIINGKPKQEFYRKLQFLLKSDTSCIIVYTVGGVGTHEVVDYFQYKGNFKHLRFTGFVHNIRELKAAINTKYAYTRYPEQVSP